MRSDHPRFLRPRPPAIESFADRLEDEIRIEIQRNPPRPPHKAKRMLERWAKLMLRPVFHGGAMAVLLVVVFIGVRPQPTIPMNDTSDRNANRATLSQWAEVIEVPDPSPKFVPFVVRERAPRFVAFAAAPPEPLPEPPVGQGPF